MFRKSSSDLRQTMTSKWLKELQETKVDRNEMNKLVMNYLVMEGFKEAAEKFQVESGADANMPMESLDTRILIREAVQNGKIDEAIELTNNFNPEILDSKSHLFYHLQQQKLIEYIRSGMLDEALEFSQTVLAELGTQNNEYLEELEKVMALLAYDEPETSPFSDLLNLSQRQLVASELNAAILEFQHLDTTPKLGSVIKLLLWSQNELDKKNAKYPKMVDIPNGTIRSSNEENKYTL